MQTYSAFINQLLLKLHAAKYDHVINLTVKINHKIMSHTHSWRTESIQYMHNPKPNLSTHFFVAIWPVMTQLSLAFGNLVGNLKNDVFVISMMLNNFCTFLKGLA